MPATQDISDAFIAARRAGRSLDSFPGVVPTNPADAYAVQHASIRAWGETLVGFKVGGVAPAFAEAFPDGWLAGPVFNSVVHTVEHGGTVDVPVYQGGIACYEAEFVMVLGGLDRLSGPVESLEEAKSYVKRLHIGAEIASSPLPTLNALGPGAIISDFGNQAGVVIGPEAPLSTLDDLSKVEVVLTIDRVEIGRKRPNPAQGGPLDALRFLLNHIQSLPIKIDMSDQLLLSSGAVTGVHESAPDTSSKIVFGDLGAFTINMTAYPTR